MKASEMRQLDTRELMEKLEQAREELFKLRLNWYAGSLENPNQMKATRREIARLLTVLRERELAAAIVLEEDSKDAE